MDRLFDGISLVDIIRTTPALNKPITVEDYSLDKFWDKVTFQPSPNAGVWSGKIPDLSNEPTAGVMFNRFVSDWQKPKIKRGAYLEYFL